MPKVSIVIPTYGRHELLLRAVRSVLAQTMFDLELLVVVDGFDSATIAVLEAETDARLRFIQHERQLGAGEARDNGVRHSVAEWIAFLDDDDEWLPNKLETQFSLPLTTKSIAMTLSRVVTPEGTFVWPAQPYGCDEPIDEWLFDRKAWFKESGAFLQTSSLLAPRALFDVLGFAEKHHEEWEIVIRAVKQHGFELLTTLDASVIHYRTEVKKSLSGKQTWRQSLVWLIGLQDLITPRAYAGFCLVNISRRAADVGDRSAIPLLWQAAWKEGRPTAKQIFAFVLMWLLPPATRRRLRSLISRRR